MEHTRVRKIPSKPYPLPSEKWDDEWLGPTLNLAKRVTAYSVQILKTAASRLARWSKPAFIVGGILWSVLLVLLYLDWASVRLDQSDLPIAWYLHDWNLQRNLQPLILPMLLFIIGLIGIYSRFTDRLNWPGKAGVLLSIVGLVMSVLTTWGFRLDTVLWWFTNLVNSDNESYGGFDNIIMEPSFFWLVSEAFSDSYLGVALLSAGLLLLSIAIIQAQALSTWVVIFLSTATLSIHLHPLLVTGFERYEYEVETIYSVGLLAHLVVFGASWAIAGYALLQNAKTTNPVR